MGSGECAGKADEFQSRAGRPQGCGYNVFAGDTTAFTAESRSPQGRGYSRFFELSPETVALPLIPNTCPRASKAARSNRESVAALWL